MAHGRKASIIIKLLLVGLILFGLMIFVLPLFEKWKFQSRNFVRKTTLNAVAATLDIYRTTHERYPEQLSKSACLARETVEQDFATMFRAENFPKDPVSGQSFNGLCQGQLWYKDLRSQSEFEKGKGFIIAASLEGKKYVIDDPEQGNLACFSAISFAYPMIETMKAALQDRSCFNKFSDDAIVMYVMN